MSATHAVEADRGAQRDQLAVMDIVRKEILLPLSTNLRTPGSRGRDRVASPQAPTRNS
jgi:hypothetical protein